MSDLFKELDETTSGQPGVRVYAVEPTAEEVQFPKVRSVDHLKQIWTEEIRNDHFAVHMPDAETIEIMRGSGWKQPGRGGWHDRDEDVDCYRWVLAELSIPVEDVVNKQHEIAARQSVHMFMDPSRSGSPLFNLQLSNATNNGQWMPVEIAFREKVRPFLDGIRTVEMKQKLEGGDAIPLTRDTAGVFDPSISIGWTEAVNINKPVLQIAVRFADLRNAPHAQLNSKGEVINEMTIKVAAPAPAPVQDFAGALDRLADAIANKSAPAPVAAAPAPAPETKPNAKKD